MDTNCSELLAWSDVLKFAIGFAISLGLIWAKNEGERLLKLRTLKRSAWNIAKHHTDYTAWLNDLHSIAESAKQGSVWVSAQDFSIHYSAIVAELASLDPKSSDTYVAYLSAEDVVRKGYAHLAVLRTEFAKARKEVPCGPEEAKSIRSTIAGQCEAIRRDLAVMAECELALLKHLQSGAVGSESAIVQLKASLQTLLGETKRVGETSV